MRRAASVALFVCACACVLAASGGAAALEVNVTGDGPFNSTNGTNITFEGASPGTTVNFGASEPFADNDTVVLNTSKGTVAFESSGPADATISESNLSDSSWTNLTAIDASNNDLTVRPAGQSNFVVGGGASDVAVRDSKSLDDGVVDFEYSGTSPRTELTLNDLPANQDVAAVDADTGNLLAGSTTDGSGSATFSLSNSDHSVTLQSDDFSAPNAVDSTASPTDGSTVRFENQTLSVRVEDPEFSAGAEVDVDIELNGSIVHSETITSNQTVSTSVGPLPDARHRWNVSMDSTIGGSATDRYEFVVDHYEPTITDPSPTGALDENPDQLSVNVSDRDFGNDGDSLDVVFEQDGTQVGTDTLNSNGTASTSITPPVGGTRDVSVTVSDEYGQSTTLNYSYQTPANLSIYNETSPSQLIGSGTGTTETTLRFFGADQVYERTTTTGKINMTNLPVNQEFVVRVSADGFEDRRIIIDSIYQQEEVYLLNPSATATNDIVLNIEDETGNFQSDETKVEISKPIRKDFNSDGNETTQYQTISGDRLDASAEFPATLDSGVRYKVRVQNNRGETRELGTITPTVDRSYNLRIQGLEFNASDPGSTYSISTALNVTGNGTNKQQALRFAYNDSTNRTSKIVLRVHPENNASNVLDKSVLEDSEGINEFAYTNVVSGEYANETLIANYTIVRDGENISGATAFGTNRYPVAEGLDSNWGAIFGVGFLIVLGGLFSLANARVGALIVPGAAMVLYVTGIIDAVASVAAIGFAFAIAVVINLVQTSNEVLQR